MYLCCIEILSGFRSKLDFLYIFEVAKKSGYFLAIFLAFSKNMLFFQFLMHINVFTLFRKVEEIQLKVLERLCNQREYLV